MPPNQQNPAMIDNLRKPWFIVGTRFRRITLPAGLLLPPLGLVAVIYLIIRAIKSKQTAFYRLAAALVVVTIIGALVYLKIYNIYFIAQLHKYSYSTLEDYKLPSKLESTTITFKKPVEFTERSKDILGGLSTATFVHVNDKTDPKISVAYMAVSLISSAAPTFEPSYTASVDKLLQIHQGKDYEVFIAPLKKYLQNNLPSGLQVDLGPPVALSTGNIKQNAWQADFRAGETAGKYTDLKGKFVFAIGKRTFYYFMVATVHYNWQSNQAVWQQAIDSIKIDQ